MAKNHTSRRIPIDSDLWSILERQKATAGQRQLGTGMTPRIAERVRARFSREHIFVTSQSTPLTHSSGLYHAFMRCCKLAKIVVRIEVDGYEVDHVDLHSLRRTFATALIANGADPKSVQELLGHKTLDMTMRIYAKVNTQTKRQALSKLPYGGGAVAPGHVLEYPGTGGFPVQNGHQTVTNPESRPLKTPQVVG